MNIAFGYLPTEHSSEPAMFLTRAGRTVAIGLSVAHRFLDDATAVKKATEYALHLYGVAGFTKSEVYRLIQVVTNEFRTLLAMPPPPMEAVTPSGVVARANGEVLHDGR